MLVAQLGDRVRIKYSRANNTDSTCSTPTAPKILEFRVGGKRAMPGLSLGVTGMTQGEQRHLTLQPAEAYGEVQAQLIRKVARDRFPNDLVLVPGRYLTAVNRATGRRRRVRIVEIKPDSIMVDANHPLAGKVVELDVHLIALGSSIHTDPFEAGSGN
jgi:peptidylprolyl isomerase